MANKKLRRFPSSPANFSGELLFAAFMTNFVCTFVYGPLLLIIPIFGWIAGPFVSIVGIIGMCGVGKSRRAECPHCGSDVDLMFPWYYTKAQKCKGCAHQLQYDEGRVYDLSAPPQKDTTTPST